ncbi:VOC family protein [Sporomusa sphaeroides]|uniref:Lyase n=2 Tax=Sporomusa TaxID=2375 RepID=A0ABM9W1K0_9FIRM|nr:VOC family protein [Sporomusa sphaeroides]OLS56730.1 metallothiol transferase FosB [Sporomusa sphaeroides DSM 2875]CVK18677.1 putative lyase [Sporomusa sphaeroides DSM 2875]SCM82008.1 Glyoxalase/bleomycin resistance protein/dioxygenase [uncultured Sporomusa sp.]
MYNIAHIGVVVKDADKSLEFYTTVLGCTREESYQDERIRLEFIKAGQQTIELIQYKEDAVSDRGPGIIDHIAFLVNDLEAELAKLRQQQVRLLLDQPKISGNKKLMFFSGPDGERLEFIQKL